MKRITRVMAISAYWIVAPQTQSSTLRMYNVETMYRMILMWPLDRLQIFDWISVVWSEPKRGVVIEHAHNMACKWFEIMSGVLCVTSAAKGTYLARRLICSCLLVGYETFLLWAWKENDIGRKKDYYDMGGSTQAAIKVCLTVALASLYATAMKS